VVLQAVAAGIGVVVTVALAAAAVAGRALNPLAGVVAAAFGVVIVVLAGFPFLALLVLFVSASALATRYRFAEKRQRNVQEGVAGERGVSNVLAHIVIPTALASVLVIRPGALPTVALLYASALSFGGADTFASEFGVLSGRARSIFSFRPVEPGTNGGVSAVGEGFALLAAALTGVVALGLFDVFRTPIGAPIAFVAIVAGAGFVGCQIDSVIGEAIENRGLLGKGGTNFAAMLATVALAFALLSAYRSLG
jgi:uncharacterized protein (TIGR00297 family)